MYKLMNKLEEADRKDQIMKRKEEARYLREHKKKQQKRFFKNDTKSIDFPREVYKFGMG